MARASRNRPPISDSAAVQQVANADGGDPITFPPSGEKRAGGKIQKAIEAFGIEVITRRDGRAVVSDGGGRYVVPIAALDAMVEVPEGDDELADAYTTWCRESGIITCSQIEMTATHDDPLRQLLWADECDDTASAAA